MKVVKPVTLIDAMLISSTATETYAAYNAATTYALGNKVTSGSVVYECIQAPNLNHPVTDALWWKGYGPTNRWAMFDSEISTQTVQDGVLTVVLKPGYVNSLAVFGLEGTTLVVTVRNGLAGPVVYSKTISLDGTIITSLYEYFYEPAVQRSEVVLMDLPTYSDAHITITITGPQAACALCSVGPFYYLGDVERGATFGLLSFSTKTTSASGVTALKKGKNSSRIGSRFVLDTAHINKVNHILKNLDGIACAWVGVENDTGRYTPFIIWGFIRDFSVEVAYPTISYCSIDLEALAQ